MRILGKYLCKEFFKLLVLCLVFFILIFQFISFVGGVDNFIEANVPMTRMVVYHLYETPFIVVQMLPPASLIAVIIMFSLMRKNNEIIALKSSGISVWKISQPILITALVLSIILFLFSEIVVPYTSSRSKAIYRIEVDKKDPLHYYGQQHIWYKGEECIYWIRGFDNREKIMKDPTLYFLDDSFRLLKRIDGRQGIWKNGTWAIKDGIILERESGGDYRVKRFDQIELSLPETPEAFVREEREPEEMSYWQLKRFAEKVSSEGYDATRHFVDLNVKLSFPFVVIALVLIGTPIALWRRKGGTPLAVFIGLLLCFVYLLALGVSRSLGLAGILPPLLSAWLANVLFFFLGLYLMQHVSR
jgi:lipopolysaccharide export system permease protein